jgi:peptidyl-prolyl cis-trans isomerase D
MAIIGKIRDKSWLILLLIGGALLAFILTDYQKITGGSEFEYGYGTVYGEMVDMAAFDEEVRKEQENADFQAQMQGQQSQPVDRAAVWARFVEEIILDKEYEALGIEVSPAEFDAYLYGKQGFKVLAEIENQFKDSLTGLFSEKMLQQAIETLESSSNPEDVKRWEASKEYYTGRRKREKYFDILRQGMYVTKLEAKNDYIAKNELKTISYVFKRYTDIPDDQIDASEKKLKAYWEKHKTEKKYENKVASREVKFFDVIVEPSKKDSVAFFKEMDKLKADFAKTKNDSLYVLNKSDVPVFNSTHQATFRSDKDEKARQGQTYPAYLDTVLKVSKIGDIIGPYEDNGNMRIAKILDFNKYTLTARHILIAAQRTDAAAVAKAQKKVDSLMLTINKDNFEEYVTKYSDDPGSKETGGKYENFMDFEMVPEFSKFATDEPIGKIGYVQTEYGFHIMEVLERKEVNYPILAIVQKTLAASPETVMEKDDEVNEMIYNLNDKLGAKDPGMGRVVLFDTLVARADYMTRTLTIEENSPKLYGFTSELTENKILELAFNANAQVGDLIKAPIKEGNRYIIAILSGIREKGPAKYEDMEAAIKRDYIKERKAKLIKAQMIEAKSMKALADKLKTEIQKADITFSNPQLAGAGYEPEVVGALFSGLKDGSRTLPLEGNSGVFVVQIEKTKKAPTTNSYDAERDALQVELSGNVEANAVRSLTKLADVIDNRRFFEYNIRR